ncbi:MAG TPA: hypothetical protein VD862_00455 [Candidatus Paceibacterota bacterium]|nr:hypothetical protein [Candidatus Paceibacterota bacterium]
MMKFTEHRATRRAASKKIVVLYHAECTDGFVAAWAAFRHFGKKAEYHAVEHQYPMPEKLTGKEVYTLDFTYPEDITRALMADNERVTSIDHHVSVADVTRMTVGGVYDNDHSGAMLSWKYFHPDVPAPLLVRIVEDYDLHRFSLPETRTIMDFLDLYDFEFTTYTKLARMLDRPMGLRRGLRTGGIVSLYRERAVRSLMGNSTYEVQFDEHKAGAINTEFYHAEIATLLAEKYHVGIAWRVRPHGTYVSLRSDGTVNVADLASRYGGGGHARSAGFVVASPSHLPFQQAAGEQTDAPNNER